MLLVLLCSAVDGEAKCLIGNKNVAGNPAKIYAVEGGNVEHTIVPLQIDGKVLVGGVVSDVLAIQAVVVLIQVGNTRNENSHRLPNQGVVLGGRCAQTGTTAVAGLVVEGGTGDVCALPQVPNGVLLSVGVVLHLNHQIVV